MYKCYWYCSEEVQRVSKPTDNYVCYACQKCSEEVTCRKEDYDKKLIM